MQLEFGALFQTNVEFEAVFWWKMCIHVGLDLLIVLGYGRPRTLISINNTVPKPIVLNWIEKSMLGADASRVFKRDLKMAKLDNDVAFDGRVPYTA